MDRRSFIKNCILLGCGAAFLYSSKLLYDAKYTTNNKKFDIHHIEFHLVEHCNLKCKYCSHFSSVAEPEFLDLEKFKKDIKRLADVTKSSIEEIFILGGEPLLHPQINVFLKDTRKYFPNSKLVLLTNGLLLETMSETFWKAMHDNQIILSISQYPVNLNVEKIKRIAEKYNITTLVHVYKTFYKANLNINSNKNSEEVFKGCLAQNECVNIADGKIFHCFVPAYIRHLNKKFNMNFEVTTKDYIDIYKAKNVKEINSFLSLASPFCRYCYDNNILSLPWENSEKHDVKEFIWFEGQDKLL